MFFRAPASTSWAPTATPFMKTSGSVPLAAPVAGIAMGLIAEDGTFVTLTDIQGVEDAFGDQSGYYKHALVKAAKYCDLIFAVGD